MASLDKSIGEGRFAKKQILSRDRIIAWSHRRRFQLGVQLAQQFAGKRILDYGCGDGSFLAMLMSSPATPRTAIGAEIHPELVADCQARFSALPGLSFILNDELESAEQVGAFDAVICMEVLEHVIQVEPLIERFDRLLAPGGSLLVSVPIETGLPLVIKQIVRRIAGWRGIGDYPGTNPYSLGEMLASLFAGSGRQHIVRPVHINADGTRFHDHKGFNWMVLREQLARNFDLEKTYTSPLSSLPPHLGSQVWFLLKKNSAV